MESRVTSANISSNLGSSRGQAITWTWLGPDFSQIHFNFPLSAADVMQAGDHRNTSLLGRASTVITWFQRKAEKKSQPICQRSESKLAADTEPPRSPATSRRDESQISSKSGEEPSRSFSRRPEYLFQGPGCKALFQQAQLQHGDQGPSLEVAVLQESLTKPTHSQSGVCKG